jgi:hypothetical protein
LTSLFLFSQRNLSFSSENLPLTHSIKYESQHM